ncbi:SGNH/GDSL hydrolase family protein [Pseudoclavibacter sp. CFCC 13796]|uniref:SGNH/GDSL hydrolase family protein n=1 Tax=Pseudoclavibacter sp. CFCC 13796 TaxID=2615179 RepID=UPI001300EC2A|nr:SGNH/GDSL hydrolase family protein [Pseudoclavibacter sp. CFCC 13796]KAB1659823.1 SGNH/GDSL hydrolase family protein [Pseudoclavibacter sp. CFCC 13796]
MTSDPSRRAFLSAALATGMLTLAGCSTDGVEPGRFRNLPLRTFGGYAPNDTVHLAVVGDSLSVGVVGQLTGANVNGDWHDTVDLGALQFLGGWSKVGATTADMARSAKPVSGADALLIMAGTNDVAAKTVFDDSSVSIGRIVDAVRLDRVSVAMIPPSNASPQAALDFNDRLRDLAGDRGWSVVDPWRSARDDQGRWVTRYRGDGTHPNQSGYQAGTDQLVDDLAEVYLGAEPVG